MRLPHDQLAGVSFELLELFYEAHLGGSEYINITLPEYHDFEGRKACHCSDDALAGQPVAVFFAHVGASLSNNDPLIDSKRPESLQNNLKMGVQTRRYAWLVALLAALPAIGQYNTDPDDLSVAFDSGTIIIEAEKDACYRFDVYLATSREQQSRGLMHVRHLPEFTGMLFSYTQPNIISMWMKNTYITLDILFIREDGTISNIATNAEPLSLKSISSTEPVSYFLELNAGVTLKLHINADSRVHL